MCRAMTLLRTGMAAGAPRRRFLDPTDAPRGGGWACKPRPRYWLPAGTPSVRQKQRPITNTAEVCVSLSLHTRALYHDLAGFARACRRSGRNRRPSGAVWPPDEDFPLAGNRRIPRVPLVDPVLGRKG